MATMKKAAAEVRNRVMNKLEDGQKAAEREMSKVKKQFRGALKSMEGYVKKNPEKVAMAAAGVGAALGAALALLVSGKKRGKK